jgi:hypothetical protein
MTGAFQREITTSLFNGVFVGQDFGVFAECLQKPASSTSLFACREEYVGVKKDAHSTILLSLQQLPEFPIGFIKLSDSLVCVELNGKGYSRSKNDTVIGQIGQYGSTLFETKCLSH